MARDAMELREQLAGLDYPVSKEDVVRMAQENGASTETLQILRSLPTDRFGSADEIGDLIVEVS